MIKCSMETPIRNVLRDVTQIDKSAFRVSSLGTRPSKNRKGGSGTSAGVEVYTAPGMKAHFRLTFD